MTDLTEQLKKGELPYAEYYIKLAGGEYTNDVWDVGGWQSFNKKGDVVVEVLAPVPSYEEYQAKLEENAQLKKQINHILRTQARQFVDNQKLQLKAEKAKDVVNIETARQIKELKERNESLNNRDINLCRIANGIRDENFTLKELLKQSRIYVKIDTEDYDDRVVSKTDKDEAKKLLTKIDEVLK